MVNAVDDGRVNISLGGLGEQDLARTLVQVLLRQATLAEGPGTLQHHIDPQFFPGQPVQLRLAQELDDIAIDLQFIACRRDLAAETPMGGAIAGQVDYGGGVGNLVDGNKLHLPPVPAFI